jgi:Uma2 family endonuclease
MSYDEWLVWEGEGRHGEWVDGEVVVFMPPNIFHQRLARFLVRLLSWYVELFDLGEVVIAPFEMRILPGRVSREPDLLFVAKRHLWRLTPERLDGPADLAIEIMSEWSVTRDAREKRDEYEAAGVREYWLLDARAGKQRTEFRQLDANGRYQLVATDADGRYRAAVLPGFWLDVAWLWQDPLPRPDDLKPIILAGRQQPDRT